MPILIAPILLPRGMAKRVPPASRKALVRQYRKEVLLPLLGPREIWPWLIYLFSGLAFVVAPVVALVIILFGGRSTRRFVSNKSILTFLKFNVCPSCFYDLTGAPTDSDCCTICPECGAAWQLTRAAARSSGG